MTILISLLLKIFHGRNHLVV